MRDFLATRTAAAFNAAVRRRFCGFAVLLLLCAVFGLRARADGSGFTNSAAGSNAPVDLGVSARGDARPTSVGTYETDSNPQPVATFKISGYGFLGALQLPRLIKLLEVPKKKPDRKSVV